MPEFMEKLARVPLRFQPGTAYMYSLATDVCGALVEHLSGVPFAEYLQRHILGPLGMADSRANDPYAIVPRRAQGYSYDEGLAAVRHNPVLKAQEVHYINRNQDAFDRDRAQQRYRHREGHSRS